MFMVLRIKFKKIKEVIMSHSDNTQRKFDKGFPKWLEFKLNLKHDDPEDRRFESRQAENRQWKKEMYA
jgi:hypothetical protein